MGDLYEYEQILLQRNEVGLGFSIAGGTDNPHFRGDPSIVITKIMDKGAAAADGRLRLNDIITHVNQVCVIDSPRSVAIDALKSSGNQVRLSVKRKRQQMVNNNNSKDLLEVELMKGSKGLGFIIAGGIGRNYVPGDNGIYISKVLEGGVAEGDGRISVGDRLACVKNLPDGDFWLDNVTQEEAVTALKASQKRVLLLIEKQPDEDLAPEVTQTFGSTNKIARSISEEELSRTYRTATLTKGDSGLGFNIVGGEEGDGVYVSSLQTGGPAELSGQVRRGDMILSVNGQDLTRASHESAALCLKSAGQLVRLQLQFKPDEYSQLEDRLRERMAAAAAADPKQLYVRSLVDWDPNLDDNIPIPNRARFLTVHFGDVFHLTNTGDEDWWQAKTVQGAQGLLPSKTRLEKRYRHKASYEPVQQVFTDYTRPVIILGPLKDRLSDDLMTEFPASFGFSIRHTTRARRPGEQDGRDYHFVASRAAMEADIQKHKFIEAGQFKENLYGTAVSSIRAVAEAGKHCLLDVSCTAIKRLIAARIYPITILVKPSIELAMKITQKSHQDAIKSVDQVYQLENDSPEYFTAIVEADNIEETYEQVKEIIIEHSADSIWVTNGDSSILMK